MKALISIIFSLVLPAFVLAQASEDDRRANTPIEPFQIIGNVYYVGAAEVTAFLVTTPKGHILIDAGFAETAAQITANVKKLGFKVGDIKLLLNTQAHFDHAGGFVELKRLSGAKMVASPADKALLEKGGRDDFTWGDKYVYEPVMVDRVVSDGERVKLGGVSVKAVFTPGHTKGCTTWMMVLKDGGRKYTIAFVGSTSSPGYKFYGNERYPGIIADYEKTFAVMKSLKPDIFLASHGSFFGLLEKAEKIRAKRSPNPFIDPEGYKTWIGETEKNFREKLEKETLTRGGR